MTDRNAPFFADVRITMHKTPAGEIVLGSGHPLGTYDRQIGETFRKWTDIRSDRPALGELDAQGTLVLRTGAELRCDVDRISLLLLERDLGPGSPVVLLSEKSIAHAILTLAAMQVGIPVVPLSPAYSARPEALDKLSVCLNLVQPGLIFVEDEAALQFDLAALAPDSEIVTSLTQLGGAVRSAPSDAARLERAFNDVASDSVAKILFTSGSTGKPKAVVNTHRNLVSNMQAMLAVLPGLRVTPPVVVDWQPWHHCGGGNHNFHAVMGGGGTYVMDRGKPTDASFSQTITLIKAMPPSIHFGTPLGYERLCDAMDADAVLRERFFGDLQAIYYSGAAMPTSLWDRLEVLARRERGAPVPLLSGYGMTEFAPLLTMSHWPNSGPDMIGVPVPGCEVKLVPVDDGWELRGRGPNLTPGYAGPEGTVDCDLDADGYLATGDIVGFVDKDQPNLGLKIKGRSEEKFKLTTGTWVPAGKLRTTMIDACAPYLRDAVITGEKRNGIGALLLLNADTVARDFGGGETYAEALCHLPSLLDLLSVRITDYNRANPASSRRIVAAMCVADLPDLAKGETTDKGHINRRKYLATRADLVDALYEGGSSAHVTLSERQGQTP